MTKKINVIYVYESCINNCTTIKRIILFSAGKKSVNKNKEIHSSKWVISYLKLARLMILMTF